MVRGHDDLPWKTSSAPEPEEDAKRERKKCYYKNLNHIRHENLN